MRFLFLFFYVNQTEIVRTDVAFYFVYSHNVMCLYIFIHHKVRVA